TASTRGPRTNSFSQRGLRPRATASSARSTLWPPPLLPEAARSREASEKGVRFLYPAASKRTGGSHGRFLCRGLFPGLALKTHGTDPVPWLPRSVDHNYGFCLNDATGK